MGGDAGLSTSCNMRRGDSTLRYEPKPPACAAVAAVSRWTPLGHASGGLTQQSASL